MVACFYDNGMMLDRWSCWCLIFQKRPRWHTLLTGIGVPFTLSSSDETRVYLDFISSAQILPSTPNVCCFLFCSRLEKKATAIFFRRKKQTTFSLQSFLLNPTQSSVTTTGSISRVSRSKLLSNNVHVDPSLSFSVSRRHGFCFSFFFGLSAFWVRLNKHKMLYRQAYHRLLLK